MALTLETMLIRDLVRATEHDKDFGSKTLESRHAARQLYQALTGAWPTDEQLATMLD